MHAIGRTALRLTALAFFSVLAACERPVTEIELIPPVQEVDRAIAERKTNGFIKVMVVKGRPVGASIVGYQAGELISLWALALANKMKMSQIAAMVAPYPTVGEVNKRAAGAYFSPRLFENPMVKMIVGVVQRFVPWNAA